MATKRAQADWLARVLTGHAEALVTVDWEGDGPAHGAWWVRWSDGPTVTALQERALAEAPYLRPLTVAQLHWGRTYSPYAWANALIDRTQHLPEITDWRELLGEAEAWLDDAEHPEHARDAEHAARTEQLLAIAGDREAAIARDALATPPIAAAQSVTESGDVIGCAQCGAPLPPRSAGAGRPGRFCSPACRTRAWRARTAIAQSVTESGDVIGCVQCGGPLPPRSAGAGRPVRFCSPACRTRAWRERTAPAASLASFRVRGADQPVTAAGRR